MKKKHFIYSAIAGVLFSAILYTWTLPQSYYQEISIKFSASNSPLVEVEIEGSLYPIAIDLGSKFQLTLNQKAMPHIHQKKSQGTVTWKDFRGKSYEAPSFIIPKITIDTLVLTDVVAKEERKDFLSNVTLWENSQDSNTITNEKLGALGRPLLERFNLLLDFGNSRIIASNSLQKLKKAGFHLDKMVKMPLEEGRGIIISVNTDLGVKKFDIDTGATINYIRASLLKNMKCDSGQYGMDTFTTSKFVMNEKDFGAVTLNLLDITPELTEMDGCLGMSFLKNHIVYIDYQNKYLYIGENQFEE